MEGIWPLVIIWILFSVLGSRKKAGNRQSASGKQQAGGTLQDKFKAALEELQRAEREAMGQGRLEPKAPQQAFTVRRHEPKPVAKQQPAPVIEDDDESSEDVFTPEGVADYDDEAEAIIARRRAAADRPAAGRLSGSIEELTPEQLQRRTGRMEAAIGGKAEHDAWHVQMQATAASVQPDKRISGRRQVKTQVLQKFADGSMRGAIIMAEILGKPKSVA